MEPTLHVIAVYLFEGLEYGIYFYVGKMADICKAYIPDEGENKRDTVKKEQISCQIYIFMYLHQILQHLYQINCHRDRFLTSGLYSQIWETLAPYVVIHINLLYHHWKILDLIALCKPLVVFN